MELDLGGVLNAGRQRAECTSSCVFSGDDFGSNHHVDLLMECAFGSGGHCGNRDTTDRRVSELWALSVRSSTAGQGGGVLYSRIYRCFSGKWAWSARFLLRVL